MQCQAVEHKRPTTRTFPTRKINSDWAGSEKETVDIELEALKRLEQ